MLFANPHQDFYSNEVFYIPLNQHSILLDVIINIRLFEHSLIYAKQLFLNITYTITQITQSFYSNKINFNQPYLLY